AAFAAAAVLTAALAVRRRRPLVAALAVEAALVACLPLPLPEDATLVHGLAVLIALYSVAVRCPGRTTAVV
ncbi:hypothetical protein G3I28_01295, partial [Streptomyces sp. SID10116]|nr:hypothetical protein [Streptomyces sp. SID10116]